ncbi:MAG: ABC transporter permease [Gemmatimonadetes bacterium]|nr:ABC transporter permease [Gemmatimonadota bacterium]
MGQLANNLRYAVRTLRRSPGFALVAILTLGLGIGANTAIFSVINAVVLRPLPFDQPERLVTMAHYYASINLVAGVSAPGIVEYQKQTNTFSAVSAVTGWAPTLTGNGEATRLQALRVVGEYFATYGVPAALGRGLRADESVAGADHVVVLSDQFWRRVRGADPAVVGQHLLLNGESYEIVGVMPPSFTSMLNRTIDLWAPLVLSPGALAGSFGNEFMGLTARLKPGVALATAQADMHALAARLKADRPDALSSDWDLAVAPLRDQVTSAGMRRAMLVLLGAVGLVLLIACANVANLQLARAASRSREIAVRVALGASPRDLVAQLLTESMVLALAGGVVGVLIALWGVPALMSLNQSNLPPAATISLDARVLLFTLGLTLLTGVLFGLTPALKASRTVLHDALKEGGRGAAGDRSGLALRRGLVIGTVAIALTLLVGAGLLARSFRHLLEVDPGFRPDHLLAFNIALPTAKYPTDTLRLGFFERATAGVAELPGVTSVGATSVLPFTNNGSTSSFTVEGHVVPPNGSGPWGDYRVVTPQYLATIGAPLKEGRFFTAQDRVGSQEVVIVDEELAATFWPGASALGKRINYGNVSADDPTPQWLTIVGVVGHTMHEGLDGQKRVQVYRPWAQDGGGAMAFVVRTVADPLTAVAGVRETLRGIDPDVAIANVNTMEALVSNTTGPRRFSMVLLSVFSLLAAGLAALGLYGVMAYTVAQRTKELGVRLALGASPGDLRQMVMRQGMRLALAGVAIGLVAAFLMTMLLRAMDAGTALSAADRLLFGVSPQDPVTFVAIPLLLVAVAMLASWLPARRATRLDPVEALRGE